LSSPILQRDWLRGAAKKRRPILFIRELFLVATVLAINKQAAEVLAIVA